MTAAGYSGKPLAQKLGLKPGMRLCILNAPAGYEALLGELPEGVEQATRLAGSFGCIQYFTDRKADLEARFHVLKAALEPSGMLWICWPKKASRLPTDLTENAIRAVGLAGGLVDVKVIAVDDRYSGLKFVYRLEDRP